MQCATAAQPPLRLANRRRWNVPGFVDGFFAGEAGEEQRDDEQQQNDSHEGSTAEPVGRVNREHRKGMCRGGAEHAEEDAEKSNECGWKLIDN